MGPKEAAYAANELLKITNVIAMHYGANPLAKGTLPQFLELMKNPTIKVFPLKPGETAQFPSKR